MTANQKPSFKLGDLVVIKSYYADKSIVTGDPLHIQPIMVVTGIEIESKKKKTHDSEIGNQIAERIKYFVMWFDNAQSNFVEKIVYQSFLEQFDESKTDKINYKFGDVVRFRTASFEIKKKKESSSAIDTCYTKKAGNLDDNEKTVNTLASLMTFVCPDLICSGIKLNENKTTFDDFGNLKKECSKQLVKVLWFNPNQQKYSEEYIPIECLTSIIKKTVETSEVHEE